MSGPTGIFIGNQGLNYVKIKATEDGDNTILEGVAGKTIVVLGYAVNVTAEGEIVFKDGSTEVGSFVLPKGGGATYSGGPHCPAWEGTMGEAVKINNGTGVDSHGHLTYALI